LEFYLLIFYLIFVFFDPQEQLPFLQPLRLPFYTGIILLIVVARKVINNIFKPAQNWLFLLFYILAIISAFTSINWEVSKEGVIFLLKILLLYYVIISILDSKASIEKFVWIFVIFATLNITITLILAEVGFRAPGAEWRFKSFFGGEGNSSNGYAMVLLSTLPFTINLLELNLSKTTKSFLIISFISHIFGIIRTRSRTGFLGLILELLMIFYQKRKNLGTIFAVILILLVVAVNTHKRTWELYSTIVPQIFYDPESPEESRKAMSGRKEQWKMAREILKENPGGVGLRAFRTAKGEKYMFDSGVDLEHIVHNAYLEIAVEMGIFASLIFISIILLNFRDIFALEKGFKDNPEYFNFYKISQSIKVALVGFSLCLITLSEHYSRFFYILIALTVSLKNLYLKEIASE